MEGKRYSRRRQEEMRRRRRRRVRRQIMVICIMCILLAAGIATIGVRMWQERQADERAARQAEEVKKVIASGYEEFLKQNMQSGDGKADSVGEETENAGNSGESAEEAAVAENGSDEGAAFARWLSEKYPKEMTAGLPEAVEDGDFTSAEAYQILGATMHVLSDDYRGWLKNAETAAEHGIYLGSGAAGSEGAGESRTARVTVAGDLCLEEDGFVIDKYDEVNDLEKCISPEILDLTRKADIFYLNHEYTVSERGEALAGKLYTFRAKPERMELLEEMGTDLVSLANNHIYDYGEEGMLDTLGYLDEAQIPYVGGGRNLEEAVQPAYFIVNGMKIGFTAASNAELTLYTPAAAEDSPGILEAYDTSLYSQVIREASKECDYLIAYIHWGPEDVNQYAEYQTAQGKEFLDAGADIVVGGHPHVLQGMEYVDGKPVIYSMGDFWFNGETKYTGLLNLEISPEGLEQMSFTPCLQTGFTTQYINDAGEQRKMFDFLESLSPNVQIDDEGVITERQE